MASSFVLQIGKYEIDSGKGYVVGEFTQLFTQQDRIVEEVEEETHYRYEVTISELKERLASLGFNEVNLKISLTNYFDYKVRDLEEFLSDTSFPLSPETVNSQRKYISYIKRFDEDVAIALLERCKNFEHGFYPSLGEHDLSPEEMNAIDDLFGRKFDEENYFHPLNLFYLLCQIFGENDKFVLYYTNLVHAGYYEPDELPIGHGYNQEIQSRNPESLIFGETLYGEESSILELKEIKGNNAVKSISQNISRYVIGFLNATGGSVLWGVTNERRVAGIKFDYASRDELRRLFYDKLETIEPNVNKGDFELKYRPVIHDGQICEDVFCVEIVVPKGELDKMYFNKTGNTWIRLEGTTKQLKGVELYDFIIKRNQTLTNS